MCTKGIVQYINIGSHNKHYFTLNQMVVLSLLTKSKPLRKQNIAKTAKSCPDNISSVVEVSNYFLKNVTITTVTTANVTTVTITTVTIWVLSQLNFWGLSQFEFLSLVTIYVFKFCHNLIFWNLVTVWVFELCHHVSFL